jgi:hypothetical protein
VIKFALIALGLIYIALGAIMKAVERVRR